MILTEICLAEISHAYDFDRKPEQLGLFWLQNNEKVTLIISN